MAGAEKLIEKIENDAQHDAETYWHEAEEKRTVMREKLMQEIDRRKTEISQMAREAAQEKKRRMAAVYDLEYKKMVLSAKQEMMQKAKALALEKLRSLGDQAYTDLMKDRLLACAQTGEGSIIVAAADNRLNQAFLADVNKELKKTLGKGNVQFADGKRDIAGGFIFIEGGMEINMSLKAQLDEAWTETETAVANALFE